MQDKSTAEYDRPEQEQPIIEKLKQEIANLKSKNVISLATDEAFALRDKEGEIRAFKQRVRLSVADKTLVKVGSSKEWIDGKETWVDNLVISAQGYEVLNDATGTCVIMPKEVLVNGQPHMNPFVERDTTNNRILAVYCRAIAFRFSSKGIPQVADWTTIFDVPSYRMIDLLAKAKGTPQAFRLLPEDFHPDKIPAEGASEHDTWSCYDFDEATKLWINTSHEEALQWFSQIIHREKKSIDFAQTFARRNASKHLHGLQAAPGPVWDITVFCWRPVSGNIIKWDATQYSQLQDRVGGMISAPGKEFKGEKPAQIGMGQERTSEENGFDEIQKHMDPEDHETIDITPETDKQPPPTHPDRFEKPKDRNGDDRPPTDDEVALINNFNTARDIDEEGFLTVCREENFDPVGTFSFDQMTTVLKKLNERIDAQNK